MPLLRGSSRFDSLVLSHIFGFNGTCECNKEEIKFNDDDDGPGFAGRPVPAAPTRALSQAPQEAAGSQLREPPPAKGRSTVFA